MKIIFCDKKETLRTEVWALFHKFHYYSGDCELEIADADIFMLDGVVVSASNPMWYMGGGLDRLLFEKYPLECVYPYMFKETRHIFFTVTVDENLHSSKEFVRRAIKGVLDYGRRDGTYLLTGLGTGIGGLPERDFVQVFRESLKERL